MKKTILTTMILGFLIASNAQAAPWDGKRFDPADIAAWKAQRRPEVARERAEVHEQASKVVQARRAVELAEQEAQLAIRRLEEAKEALRAIEAGEEAAAAPPRRERQARDVIRVKDLEDWRS